MITTYQQWFLSLAQNKDLRREDDRIIYYLVSIAKEDSIEVAQVAIAKALGMQRQNVYRAMKRLEKQGFLQKTKEGRRLTYRFSLPTLSEVDNDSVLSLRE